MLPSVQDIRAFGIPGQEPHLYFLANELHRRVIDRMVKVYGGIPVYLPGDAVVEAFLQPFPALRAADPLICTQVPFQRRLACYGMNRRIMLPDVFGKHPVKLFQGLDLGQVNPIQPPLLQRPEVSLDFLSEHSQKKSYATLFIIRIFPEKH